jgi:hypothetical protein
MFVSMPDVCRKQQFATGSCILRPPVFAAHAFAARCRTLLCTWFWHGLARVDDNGLVWRGAGADLIWPT